MAPPSALSIATSSVQRLVKEEASYHKELKQQEARLEKLLKEEGDENQEYQLKQERSAIAETKAVFPPLRQRIKDAIAKLEDKLEQNGDDKEEAEKAQEAIASAKKTVEQEL